MKVNNQKYKVAAVQDSPVFLDKKETTQKTIKIIKEAASNRAELVLFPEAFISGYPDWVWTVPPSNKDMMSSLFSLMYDSAVSIGDSEIAEIQKTAKDLQIFVVIGFNEKNIKASNTSLYNSMLYINKKGEILGVHRKLIPTGGERLMWGRGDGTTLHSFDTELGKIGGLICWENFMPLARNKMYENGVQLYLAPTWDSSESWQIAMRYIAREGGMYLISCAQAIRVEDIPDDFEFRKLYSEDREWINKGNSCIVDPKGQIIAGPLSAEKNIVYADIDLGEIKNQKWLFDVSGHYSRPDVFDFKLK
jgi:nitrilase